MPGEVPTDGQTVWVRLQDWSGEPFKATWDAGSQSFKAEPNELVFPWYIVARWKPIS